MPTGKSGGSFVSRKGMQLHQFLPWMLLNKVSVGKIGKDTSLMFIDGVTLCRMSHRGEKGFSRS